ncbi:hypothetical protein PoB_000821500 [Plakobranchus ocellatus]|uniref:Uncharacterized protein n=1 Tax=Plakobranchus ocellatus TaxID=259542 RepID=A0AAV3YF64_9GAST|nr:hypothetical protein PoB_000821500 [Plakobranchus ocellatus]
MLLHTTLLILLGVAISLAAYPPKKCYRYEDITAKYKMRHDKSHYPTNEINLVLDKYPYMKTMFHKDEHTYASVPNPYVTPLSSVCPHDKFTLYSFFYANKDCYVIYPDVQQVTYIQCSSTHNRNCQQCSFHGPGGGVSKCVEDYQYRYVWAYCKHAVVTPKPRPRPQPKPQPKPHPTHQHPKTDPFVPIDQFEIPKVVDLLQKYNPRMSRNPYPSSYHYHDPWNRIYRPLVRSNRWRRSYNTQPQTYGTMERMALYLPYHCGCKTYTC